MIRQSRTHSPHDAQVRALVRRMSLDEKIGQMTQVDPAAGPLPADIRDAVRCGQVGAILNVVDVDAINELQRIALHESRLGIPLLVGRDVIHGFATVLPIPLGQAATWNPELVRQGAAVAAREAAARGVNWTFAPMIDISRDPRWGRIAESLGEDPHLCSVLGAAMVCGFQGDDLAATGSIAACAKHFAGYGASEGGRDYASTNITENELRNVYLPPFRAAAAAGVATFMASFSDLDGLPASANAFLMRQVLRDEWGFDGFVVSDWASIEQLTVHGLTAGEREAARAAVTAGINMEMASLAYTRQLRALVESGAVDEALLDELVAGILAVKMRLGLFDGAVTDPADYPRIGNDEHLRVARELALQSIVLLENRGNTLPLNPASIRSLAVIGPLADDAYEQLGTWIFDGDPALSRTPLQAIRAQLGDAVAVTHVRALDTTRSRSREGFADAVEAAAAADAVVLFVGEESILSGEAHSRADIGLPGSQEALVHALRETGKPLIVVVMAGRPLTLASISASVDALLFAWHPGSMGGPAIADILFGVESPSGRLPVTFPRMVGQVPIYYAHRNTGKPAVAGSVVLIDDIPVRAPQTSFGMTSFHLDAGHLPLYPFGHGLSYACFAYSGIALEKTEFRPGEPIGVQAVVCNTGTVEADEVVQLYVRDLAASVTRPVRELKKFLRLRLAAGESRTVRFTLAPGDLAFHGRDMRLRTEPGEFHVWIGASSTAALRAAFRIIDEQDGGTST